MVMQRLALRTRFGRGLRARLADKVPFGLLALAKSQGGVELTELMAFDAQVGDYVPLVAGGTLVVNEYDNEKVRRVTAYARVANVGGADQNVRFNLNVGCGTEPCRAGQGQASANVAATTTKTFALDVQQSVVPPYGAGPEAVQRPEVPAWVELMNQDQGSEGEWFRLEFKVMSLKDVVAAPPAPEPTPGPVPDPGTVPPSPDPGTEPSPAPEDSLRQKFRSKLPAPLRAFLEQWVPA